MKQVKSTPFATYAITLVSPDSLNIQRPTGGPSSYRIPCFQSHQLPRHPLSRSQLHLLRTKYLTLEGLIDAYGKFRLDRVHILEVRNAGISLSDRPCKSASWLTIAGWYSPKFQWRCQSFPSVSLSYISTLSLLWPSKNVLFSSCSIHKPHFILISRER